MELESDTSVSSPHSTNPDAEISWESYIQRQDRLKREYKIESNFRKANTSRGYDVPKLRIERHRIGGGKAVYNGSVAIMGRFRIAKKIYGGLKRSRKEAKLDAMVKATEHIRKMQERENLMANEALRRVVSGEQRMNVDHFVSERPETYLESPLKPKKTVRWQDEVSFSKFSEESEQEVSIPEFVNY